MEGKKISVIMGTFNCADTVEEAIESILSQTYTNWEFVICDDASTDGTPFILNKYKEKYPGKFVILRNEENRRLAYSLNRCLEAASGYYIARMDGDDISRRDRFQKQVEYLERNPDIQLVGTSMQRFDDKGKHDIVHAYQNPDRWTLQHNIPYNHATIMTYKSVYEVVGGYTVEKRTLRGQDYDLWFKFYGKGFNGNNIDEPLYLVRENLAAIKRRRLVDRWRTFQTSLVGYRMLGYPWYCYLLSFISVFKGLVPAQLVLKYREYQSKR